MLIGCYVLCTVIDCFSGTLQPLRGARAGGASASQTHSRLLQQPEA